MVAMGLVKSSHKVWQRLGQGDTRLGGEEVDSSGAVSVLLDETAVVLRAWRRVDGCPAVLAVVAQAVDVATEVGGVASTTMQSMTFITHLVIKNIWFHLDLWWREGGGGGGGIGDHAIDTSGPSTGARILG